MRKLSITFLRIFKKFLILNIEHAMSIALEIRISNLLPEFLADALVFLSSFQATGAVTAGTLQSFFNHLDHFFVIVQTYSHGVHFLSDLLYDRGGECQERETNEKETCRSMSLSGGRGGT